MIVLIIAACLLFFLLWIFVAKETEDEDEDCCESEYCPEVCCEYDEEELQEERLRKVESDIHWLNSFLGNLNNVVQQNSRDILSTRQTLESHRTDFSHPYKTDREVKIDKAKAFGVAFTSLLDDYGLTMDDVMDEVLQEKKATKKSQK